MSREDRGGWNEGGRGEEGGGRRRKNGGGRRTQRANSGQKGLNARECQHFVQNTFKKVTQKEG